MPRSVSNGGVAAPVLKDRYELGRHIARGGMGDVFEAQDQELQRRVAVKMFRGTATDDRARFKTEAVTLAALNHPGLVQVYDAGEYAGDAFVVLEFVDGPTLASRLIDDGPPSQSHVAELGAQVADALAYVHERGVVHRDVTPSNILCDLDGRPRLADFGIARLTDATRMTAPATASGTAAYMAPEQVLGQDVTPAADIFALGLVLLEMLTGHKAYVGSPREVAAARLVRPPSVPSDIPDGWRRLIQDMTDPDASSRPSAAEVRDRLESPDLENPDMTDAFVVTPVLLDTPTGTMEITSGEAASTVPLANATSEMPAELVRDDEPEHRRILLAILATILGALLAVLIGLALARDGGDATPSTTTVTEPAITVTTTSTTQPPVQQDQNGQGKNGNGKAKGKG